MIPILASTDAAALRRLLDRTPDAHGRLEPAVKDIVAAVRTRCDTFTPGATVFDHAGGTCAFATSRMWRAALRMAARTGAGQSAAPAWISAGESSIGPDRPSKRRA